MTFTYDLFLADYMLYIIFFVVCDLSQRIQLIFFNFD